MRKCTALIDGFRNAAAHRTLTSCSASALGRDRRQFATGTPQYNRRVAVLGGGITGLATAYYLRQHVPHVGVTLFEANQDLGGWLQSNLVLDGDRMVLFEAGPRSLRTAGNGVLAMRLVQDLKLMNSTIFTSKTAAAATHRYLYYPDRLVRMPHPSFGLFENLKSVLTEPIFKGLFAALVNDFRAGPRDDSVTDESIASFIERRCRPEIVDNILSGVIHGIYAGDVDQLSVRSLFPRLWQDDRSGMGLVVGGMSSAQLGVLMKADDAAFYREMQLLDDLDPELLRLFSNCSVFTFADGMRTLPDALVQNLRSDSGVEVRSGCAVRGLLYDPDRGKVSVETVENEQPAQEQFDEVVSTLSAAHLDKVISSNHEPAYKAAPLSEIPSVSVMTVNLLYERDQKVPPGPGPDQLAFGYLIPRATPFEQNPERALGVVFDHAYSPPWTEARGVATASFLSQDRLPNGGTKLTVMLGGHWWNGWSEYPDEHEGLKLAKSVVARHLDITDEPTLWRVNMQRDCIPQYTVGHADRLKDADGLLREKFGSRLRVAGNWISGVGVNDCLRSAYDTSRALQHNKNSTGLESAFTNQWVRVKTEPRI